MSAPFPAFRLPIRAEGTDAPAVAGAAGALPIRYPAPGPGWVGAVAAALREAGEALAERPGADVVRVVDAAAARLADPADSLRRAAERMLPAVTGYSPAQVTLIVDRMAADWRAPALRHLLRSELGDPAVLDRFVPAGGGEGGAGRRTRAFGPRLGLHVFAGNVPGVAVTSIVRSLLVKAPVLGKLAADDPVLPALFVDALASVDPAVAAAVAVVYWPGGTPDAAGVEAAALREADFVVLYGGPEAEASIRQRCPPGTRLRVHGPRFSAGIVARAALGPGRGALVEAVALAVATFDQRGCVSPHALWVEERRAGDAMAFAAELADALERLEATLPRGDIPAGDAAAIQQERGGAELRAHAGAAIRVYGSRDTRWTVVHDPDPAFRPSCLNRFLRVHPVPALEEAVARLAAAGRALQSVVVAAPPDVRARLADRLARVGATRVTTFDRLPWPPAEWHHDGRGPLRELLTWVDLED